VEVARSMLVGRRVAATDVAAGHAKTQVDPITADSTTIFTALGAWCHRAHLVEV